MSRVRENRMHGSRWRREESGTSRLRPRGAGASRRPDTRLGLKRLLERVGSPRRVDLRSLTVQRPQAVVRGAAEWEPPGGAPTGAAEGAGCTRDMHVDSQLVQPANIRIHAPISM